MDSEPLNVLASPSESAPNDNPYVSLLYDAVSRKGAKVTSFNRRRLLGRYDVVHIHWPEALVRWERTGQTVVDIAKVVGLLAVARLRGSVLVWTGHDLAPHEVARPILSQIYWRLFLRQVDLVLSLSDAGTSQLITRYPRLHKIPVSLTRHGHYRTAHVPDHDQEDSRRLLGLPNDKPIFLALGQVRPYKNIPALVETFRKMGTNARLAVVGGVKDASLAKQVTDAATGALDVHLHLESVASAEVTTWVVASDVMVLAYSQKSALNSGAALLALSLGRPVVMTESAASRELKQDVGDEWVYLTDGSPERTFEAALVAAGTSRSPEPLMAQFEWDGIAEATVAAYRRAVLKRRSARRRILPTR